MYQVKLSDIFKRIKVEDFEVVGETNRMFSAPAPIWDSGKNTITFCSETIQSPEKVINLAKASIVIASKKIDSKKLDLESKSVVLVDEPRTLFVEILKNHI